MKKEEGRHGRRFSLINLRSSPKTKSVSLYPTVTVLTPLTSPTTSNSTSSLTITQCEPQSLEPRLSEAAAAASAASPSLLPVVPQSRSPTPQLELSSASIQTVPVSSTLQRIPSTSSSQLQLVPSSSTLHLLSVAGNPSALEIVPSCTSATALPPMILPSGVQRIPSFTSVRNVPSTSSSMELSLSAQNLYSTSPPPMAQDASPAPSKRRSKSSSKIKSKKESRKASKQAGSCSDHCPHKNHKRGSVDSLASSSVSETTHLSKREILKKYRLHICVTVFFVIGLLFVSLGWYFRDLTREQELSKQKIFIDPKSRILTLSDHHDEIHIKLGQDVPPWQLPLHCPVQPSGNPNTKECEWKNNALLHIDYFVAQAPDGGATAQCYNVSWNSLSRSMAPYDCFELGSAVWYGPSNQSEETLPIRGSFDYVPTPYHLSDSGVFSSAVDFYWLSSSGVGLLLNPDSPLSLHWNSTTPGHMCVISNYTGPLYGDTQRLSTMNYTICNGPDPIKTHMIMKRYLRSSEVQARPLEDMFGFPQWSVSGLSGKADYDQHDVLDVVSRIKMHGLNCSLLMLDGDWQTSHGDLTFDPARFANLSNMTESVASTCKLGLQVSPYFDYRSIDNFHDGVAKDLFVKDAGGQVPGLTRWQNGPAVAMLDVSFSASRTWFNTLITHLLKDVNAKALRFSYGTDGWLPYKATFSEPGLSLCKLKSQMSEMVSKFSSRLVLEHTSGSQTLHGFIAVSTEMAVKDGRSCLVHTIEKALTLGLLGYPYVLADGFSIREGRQSFHSSQPSRDLYIRWMQMAAFFPAFQFSVPPWIYTEETTRLAVNLSKIHVDVMTKVVREEKLQKELAEGLPILRPVWWQDPANSQPHALRINDEFLVGDSVLVAPILCEGVTQRSVYVPSGVWSDKLRNTVIVGPKILEDYRVELNEVPYFERMPTYEEINN